MGLNASKRVKNSLSSSASFKSACQIVYADCIFEAQHAFDGIRRYQLAGAATRLHALLLTSHPLIARWAPSTPSQTSIDAAIRCVAGEEETLSSKEFREFALELFKEEVIAGARAAVVKGVPLGVAGIAGIGVAAHAGAQVVGKVIGVYAVGLVATVYVRLG